jgi:hypothetical protein
MRARGFSCRDAYADVLRGFKTVEELLDYNESTPIAASELTPLPAADPPITQDQARAFGAAWKQSGWKIEEAKSFLREKLGIESSLKIKASQYTQAMAWANKAEAPKEAPATNGNGNGNGTRERELCFELFRVLGMDAAQQATAIKEHSKEQVTDWKQLNIDLEKQLPKE